MQNFRNSSAPPTLPPGFSGASGVAGGNSPYLPPSSGPQCSPRMAEEYAGVQQQLQQNPQTQNQHLHHLVPHHHTQASLMLGYGARNRGSGSGEALHGSTHSGSSSISNNPYRKEMVEHYFSMSGKERHKRGGQGMGYGSSFGYPNMDGHMSHQYRHSGTGSGSSGMMAHYQLDYSVPAGSGGSSSSSSSSSGTGAFSPSNQYTMTQNPSIQTPTGPPIHPRQQAQNYPSQQALHQGQQHRGYPVSGHRLPPQFSHYPSAGTSTTSQGMYSSPPLRYHGGSNSGSFECKVSSSTTNSNPNSNISSSNSNTTGPLETGGQNYPSSGYTSYHSQPSHSHHKHPTHTHRGSQHNLGPSYDNPHKIHPSSLLHQPPPGLPYTEHPPTSVSSTNSSSNPSIPHFSSQEKSKSPMHSQAQQSQVHQNFSPISNPSPVASTVQSPSCSSSPSPLMGISESGNSTGPTTHPPIHPPLQKTRNSHSHSRLLQTMSQLSPTPNSNSSISSCGSNSGNVNTVVLNSSPGSNHPVLIRSRIGIGTGGGVREENSSTNLYPSSPLDKLVPDPGINSLNALTSQVANLPNTVQHMLLSDSLLSHKTTKDVGYQGHIRENQMQPSHAIPTSQQKSRGISATFSTRAAREGIGTVGCGIANSEVGVGEEASQVPESPIGGKAEGEEQFSGGEGGRVRQMSGTSSGSEPSSYYSLSQKQRAQAQSITEQGSQSLPLQVEMGVSAQKSQTHQTSPSVPQLRTSEHDTHSSFPKSPSSSSPSSHPPSALPSPNLPPSCQAASSVPTSSTPSPSLIPSFQPSIAVECDVDAGISLREQERGERENKNEKEEGNEDSKEEQNGSSAQKDETKVVYEGARDGDKQREKERETEMCSHPSKRKENEEENQDKTQDSEDLSKHAGGIGVIVSTRSEISQPGHVSEQPQTAPSAPPCSLNQSHNPQNFAEETHSHFGESSSLNGEDSDSMCSYPSNYGTKVSHKSSSDQSPHPPSSESQRFSYRSSELHHVSGMDFKNRGRGGMTTNMKYQGYHQPQPNYNSGPRKSAGVTGVEEPGRRGVGSGGSRGQENNSQQPFPSLLQEVLQGYHLDRCYGRTENLAAKIPNAISQSQNIAQPHSRHPYEIAENTRPQIPQTGVGVDHKTFNQMAASGKPHSQNQNQVSGIAVGQDPSLHSWGSVGVGQKGEHCSSSDKRKIGTSQRSTASTPQATESSARPPPKHINLADYSLPHRKPSSNVSTHHSAVQQILLQETEPLAGNGKPKGQTQSSTSSSLLTSVSSSERRSVICDVSPSRRTTPERERDGEKESDYMRSRQLTGSSVASVIQQSHLTPSESENNKLDEKERLEIETVSQTTKETPNINANLTSHSANFSVKEAFNEHQNRSPHPSVDTNSGPQRPSSGKKGDSNSTSSTVCHPQQAIQHSSANPSPLSSPSSRCQSYFQGLDESSSRSPGIARYGFADTGVGTPKAISYHPHYPSHPHPYILSQSQLENPKTTSKLQMYPHSHSLQHSHGLDDRCEWTPSNSNKPCENMMLSPTSSSNRHTHQSPSRLRSHTSVLATQQPHHQQGSYYDNVKMWGLSEREDGGTLEAGNCRRAQLSSPVSSGAVTLPGAQTSDPKCLQSNPSRGVRDEMVKSFHPVSTSSPQNKSGCSSSSSSGSSTVNLGAQQSHGPNKMGGPGDTNPLMMRRRVRSFISPIPAKRQHQDASQQHQQRNASGQYSSPLPTSESKHQNDADSSSQDLSHSKMPNATFSASPSPTHGKTKILPPRKGRGLKLEAIVQKITPNVKKASNNSSHTDLASNHLSGLPHAQVTDCHPETQDQDTCVDGNFPRIGTGSGSCLPYMGEGLSLDEIMYYRGVEETGPLPPTAYPCDPHQDQQILKHDITRGAVGDLEPDFGMGTSVSPLTERDCVGERGKDDLRIPSDFTLLGPLPPPPPLPRPVQPSPPPSSSALSDIQHFTNTYQQLETRRGEQSAANLLRQKLQESGMGLGLDDYTGSDYFGTQPPHHNQNAGPCLLTRAPHTHQSYQQHLVPSSRTTSSMTGLSQLTEPKPSESIVPKGYFPSGKKKGRPVGSVNKQKRAQVQTQNVSLNAPAITHTPAHIPVHIPTPVATPQIDPSTSATTESPQTSPPTDTKISSGCIYPTASQTVKVDAESKDVQAEIEVKSQQHRQRKDEDGSDGVWAGSRRRRRRGVVGMVGKENLSSGTGIGGTFSGSFSDYRKSVFVPYIHVERKEEEIGAVCTIVNAEDERMKGENGGEGGTDTVLNSAFSSQGTRGDKEMEVKEKKETEQVDSALLQSCTTGKAVPSSGYVLSGAVMTESSHFGQLLCCLCKKWANYKNLGDLYGPYYPPEYTPRLPKNHPQIRQSLLTTRVGSTGVTLGTVSTESTQQDVQQFETLTGKSVTEPDHTGNQASDSASVTATDTECPVSRGEMHGFSEIGHFNADMNTIPNWDLTEEYTSTSEVFKQCSNNPEEKQEQPQNQQWLIEDMQQRPQHRKLTSHPRFKRRHKSSEDVPKSTHINSKALLPFQPPPQLLNQDTSDPLAQLAQLPQMPLDPEELWVHEGCIVWASGVFLVNGRLYGLKEALDGARDTCCSHCEMVGSTLGCYSKGCTLRYHYLCALEADCSLNEDNFSLRCPKHKFPQNSGPVKSVYPEQSERG